MMKDRSKLHTVNTVCTVAILVIFLYHATGNALVLAGVNLTMFRPASDVLLLLCLIHIVISVVLTVDSLRATKESGKGYYGLNKRYLAVRLSAIAIVIFIVLHS